MRRYELMVILDPDLEERTVAPSLDKFLNVVRKGGGTVENVDIWGRRRLAYEIKNFQKGHYQVLHFLSDGKVVPELERSARLDDSILRFLTVLANEQVVDVEARRSEAVLLEEERKKRAAEKAVRDAEEAARAAEEASAMGSDARGDDDDDDDDDDIVGDDDRDRDRDRDEDRE